MKIILSVIAVSLVMITVKLYTPEANANPKKVRFEKIVKAVIEECKVSGNVSESLYLSEGKISC